MNASIDERLLLLVHIVDAAASAFEVKPLFEHYRRLRPVYAIDLPRFGKSDRSDRSYSVRMMTDAVLSALAEIRRRIMSLLMRLRYPSPASFLLVLQSRAPNFSARLVS